MKSGYDQFFKKARENAGQSPARDGSGSNSARKKTAKPRFDLSNSEQRTDPTVDQITRELRQRLQNKKKKRHAKIPWKLAGASFVGMLLAAAGFLEHARIETILKNVEISMIGSASAEEKSPAPTKAKPEVKKEETKAAGEAPKKTEFSQEELNHFAKLNERKHELDAREEELNRMETEIQAQKAEIEKKIQTLDKTRRDISSVLEEKVKTDDKKIETLVQTYSNMKPQQAAKVLEEMNEDLAVEIVGRMKKKNAAEIMNLLKPEKAKIFAEKFAGYKRD